MPRTNRMFVFLASACIVVVASACDSTEPVPPPTKLAFVVEPASSSAGAVIAPAVTVSVLQASGERSSGSSASVTLALTPGTGSAGATLGGTLTRAAVNGTATFNDLTLDKAGAGYTLTATSGSLTAATSSPFGVVAGSAASIAFTLQPSAAEAGTPISPAVQVTVEDALGNPASASVTLSLTPGTGAPGATLGGSLTRPTVDGVASFGDLVVDKTAGDYTLTASTTGLSSVASQVFYVVAGPPTTLVAVAGDGQTVTVGTAPPIMPTVDVRDQFGNLVSSASVVFAVTQGSGILVDSFHVTGMDGRATLGAWEVDGLGANVITAMTAGGAVTTTFTATAVNLQFTYTPNVIGGAWTLWASSLSNVFFSGGYHVLRYFNGVTWGDMTSALGANGYGLCGRSATDVFNTGQWGVQHFDGTNWTSILGNTDEIIDCWAESDIVYASGDGTLRSYQNGSWTSIPTGLSPAFNTDRLEQLWGTGTGVVYAAGRPGVLKYDGSTATLVPGLPINMVGVGGSSADNVFAVGQNGEIWRFDGSTWAQMNSGTSETLTGVAALSPKNVYAVGNTGILLRYDGISWAPVPTGNTSAWYSEIQALSPTSLVIAAPPGVLVGAP